MLSKDESLKRERGYKNRKSFVRNDGSERLCGNDWTKRKKQLEKRSGGRCERWSVLRKAHDAFCYGKATEAHHIIPRSRFRDDRLDNLAHLSHACHSAEDRRKVKWSKQASKEFLNLTEGK